MKTKKKASIEILNAPTAKHAKSARKLTAIKEDAQKYGVAKCCVKHYWAVVDRNGALIRGRNVFRTKRLGPGRYEVYFTGLVDDGVFNATIGRPGIATEPTGQIGVALRCCPTSPFETNRGVWVDTHDTNGKPSDRSFHLSVLTHV